MKQQTLKKTFFASDHHLGHKNIITFLDKNGNRMRPFSSIEEHDETIINNHNKIVSDADRVYFMGDVAINRKYLPLIARMNGRKILLVGNHDIFKVSDYIPYFEDIKSYRIYPNLKLIISHIPVHTSQLDHRFKFNVHGHTHSNLIDDLRYINLCMEHTNFSPVSLDDLISKIEERSSQIS